MGGFRDAIKGLVTAGFAAVAAPAVADELVNHASPKLMELLEQTRIWLPDDSPVSAIADGLLAMQTEQSFVPSNEIKDTINDGLAKHGLPDMKSDALGDFDLDRVRIGTGELTRLVDDTARFIKDQGPVVRDETKESGSRERTQEEMTECIADSIALDLRASQKEITFVPVPADKEEPYSPQKMNEVLQEGLIKAGLPAPQNVEFPETVLPAKDFVVTLNAYLNLAYDEKDITPHSELTELVAARVLEDVKRYPPSAEHDLVRNLGAQNEKPVVSPSDLAAFVAAASGQLDPNAPPSRQAEAAATIMNDMLAPQVLP